MSEVVKPRRSIRSSRQRLQRAALADGKPATGILGVAAAPRVGSEPVFAYCCGLHQRRECRPCGHPTDSVRLPRAARTPCSTNGRHRSYDGQNRARTSVVLAEVSVRSRPMKSLEPVVTRRKRPFFVHLLTTCPDKANRATSLLHRFTMISRPSRAIHLLSDMNVKKLVEVVFGGL